MDKLLQSPLFDKIRTYITQTNENEQIFLYVPYIKSKIIDKLLKNIPNQVSVITTWRTEDLVSGSSDIKLYDWCKDKEYFLYINNQIHLKIYSVNLESAIVASGNISHNGLEGGKYEVGVFVEKLSNQNRIFLEKIKKEAHLVDDDKYQQYLENYEKWKKKTPEPIQYEQPEIKSKEEYFLISALPMTDSIEEVIQGYLKINSNLPPSENKEIANCIFHDLANYNIPNELSEDVMREKLAKQFLSHPFTRKIMDEIDNHERKHFGMIKNWVRDHCTEVPLPRPWEFNKNTKILMNWLVESKEYEKFKYGEHTESIRRIKSSSNNNHGLKKYEKEILEILTEPGKTIDEIRNIYHDIDHRPPKDEPSSSSELENASKPIWHFKVELNNKIKKIALEEFDKVLDDLEEKKIEKYIAYAIGKLESDGTIIFWYHESGYYSDGIWRLK